MKRTLLSAVFFAFVAAGFPNCATADTIYDSGPSTYAFDGWTLNGGLWVSNSFTLTQSATITGITFVAWLDQGDTLSSVDWAIGGSTDAGSFTTATTTGTLIEADNNSPNFAVYNESFAVSSLVIGPGTYYLTLQNSVEPNGDPAYWDENDGTSIGFESLAGSISTNDCNASLGCGLSGGETFTLDGTGGSGGGNVVPEPPSILLLGSGLAGLAAFTKRKLRS